MGIDRDFKSIYEIHCLDAIQMRSDINRGAISCKSSCT